MDRRASDSPSARPFSNPSARPFSNPSARPSSSPSTRPSSRPCLLASFSCSLVKKIMSRSFFISARYSLYFSFENPATRVASPRSSRKGMPANISGIISFSELCEDTKIVDDANILLFSNHCRFFPRNDLSAAVILDFRGSIWESLQRGMVSAAVVVAATRSVSDSNFRSGKEEWFRL